MLFEILVMWLEMRKFFAYSAWFQSCISVKTKQLKLELFKLLSLNLKQCLKLSGFARQWTKTSSQTFQHAENKLIVKAIEEVRHGLTGSVAV